MTAGFGSHVPGIARAVAVLGALAWLGAGCTDPRPRPAPPTVVVTLSATVRATSPGSLQGSVYFYDASGLASLQMTASLSNGAQIGDSAIVLTDPFEMTQPFQWRLVGGIPTGTRITVVVRAVSYLGFEAADTAVTAVADSV